MKILIIDSDQSLGELLKSIIEELPGYQAVNVKTVEVARTFLSDSIFDCVVLDFRTFQFNQCSKFLNLINPIKTILLSTTNDPHHVEFTHSNKFVLQKPFDIDDLYKLIY